jgi:hypothetical protein
MKEKHRLLLLYVKTVERKRRNKTIPQKSEKKKPKQPSRKGKERKEKTPVLYITIKEERTQSSS